MRQQLADCDLLAVVNPVDNQEIGHEAGPEIASCRCIYVERPAFMQAQHGHSGEQGSVANILRSESQQSLDTVMLRALQTA